jgi:hypothetical protein
MDAITINNKQYPYHVGWNLLRKVSAANRGIGMREMLQKLASDIEFSLTFYHMAMREGARKEKKEFTLSIEECVDLLDDDPDGFAKVMESTLKQVQMMMGIEDDEVDDNAQEDPEKNEQTPGQ